jgi:hypothetical protein
MSIDTAKISKTALKYRRRKLIIVHTISALKIIMSSSKDPMIKILAKNMDT